MVAPRAGQKIEPVEVEPTVAVEQEKIVLQPVPGVSKGAAGPKRGRRDREFDPTGEALLDPTLRQERADELAPASGNQQDLVKSAPTGFADQRFEKRRSAEVKERLRRGCGYLAGPAAEVSDEDCALIAQNESPKSAWRAAFSLDCGRDQVQGRRNPHVTPSALIHRYRMSASVVRIGVRPIQRPAPLQPTSLVAMSSLSSALTLKRPGPSPKNPDRRKRPCRNVCWDERPAT